MAFAKEFKEYPSVSSYLKFYKCENEDVGEGTPLHADGTCIHPFLIPNINRTKCILPARVDVGKHYIMSGGVMGLKV